MDNSRSFRGLCERCQEIQFNATAPGWFPDQSCCLIPDLAVFYHWMFQAGKNLKDHLFPIPWHEQGHFPLSLSFHEQWPHFWSVNHDFKSLHIGKKARDLVLKWLQNTSHYHTIKISARRIGKLKKTAKIWVVIVRKCHAVVKTSSTKEQKSNKLHLRQWFHIFKAKRWPTSKLYFRLTFLICEELLWGKSSSASWASSNQRHRGRDLTQSTPCCRGTSRQWGWCFACLSPVQDLMFPVQLLVYHPHWHCQQGTATYEPH